MVEPPPSFAMEESVGADGNVRLSLRGELDLSTAGELRLALERLRSDRVGVRLDLSRLAFIDSSGIAVLVEAVRANRALQIEDQLEPAVRRVFVVTGIDVFLRDTNQVSRTRLSPTA
jgi:anti-anti-sigma factor